MFDTLEQLDQQLFLWLNQWHSPFFDELMRWVTYRFTWIPFYLFLAIYAALKLGWKKLLLILPLAFILIALSDQLSVHLFKNYFLRYRPCHNLEIKDSIHLIDGCGGIYGFVSSHAANTFALAVFMGNVFRPLSNKALPLLLLWATLVSYSRIYAGVHYPADIVVGASLGILMALLISFLYKKVLVKFDLQL
jgi:undecaprenyl-diphosphatase